MGISIWMHLTYISLYNHVQTKIDKYLIDPIWDDWPFSSSFKLPLYYYYCCDFFLGFKVKWTAETRRKQIPSYPIKIYPKKLVPKVLHSHLFTIFPLFFWRFRHFAGFRATPKLVFCRLRSSIIWQFSTQAGANNPTNMRMVPMFHLKIRSSYYWKMNTQKGLISDQVLNELQCISCISSQLAHDANQWWGDQPHRVLRKKQRNHGQNRCKL